MKPRKIVHVDGVAKDIEIGKSIAAFYAQPGNEGTHRMDDNFVCVFCGRTREQELEHPTKCRRTMQPAP